MPKRRKRERLVNAAAQVATPQSMPLREDQVANRAGGYVWKVDDMMRLRRFVTLGSEKGCYYATATTLDIGCVTSLLNLISKDRGVEVVELLKKMSVEGRTAKQDNLLFALCVCARSTDLPTKWAAYQALGEVARIPTHLFQFIEYTEQLGRQQIPAGGTGWGRATRRAISNWYLQFQENPHKLAMLATKYRMRNTWTHRDVLRLAHPKTEHRVLNMLFNYMTHGLDTAKTKYFTDLQEDTEVASKVLTYLEAVEALKECRTEFEAEELIRANNLVREHVPTTLLNGVHVWQALIENMPLTALIRNLGKMSLLGLFGDAEDRSKRGSTNPQNNYYLHKAIETLTNESALHKAKIHPFNVLVAKCTYEKGRGDKGKLQWPVNQSIVKALEKAFYMSFKSVVPTGKRFCLALDVSGSMSSPCLGSSSISCAMGSAAMAMVTMRTEEHCTIMGFATEFRDLRVTKTDTLEEVLKKTSNLNFGGTDCAQPMLWALKYKKTFDAFLVYTDSETWHGKVHPSEALTRYRDTMNIPDAKLTVVAMQRNEFTIADPEDSGMMDMCGFDSAAPEIIRAFVEGEI